MPMSQKDETIANQAVKLNDLAKLLDDAEGARTGRDSGIALILQEIADILFDLAGRPDRPDAEAAA